MTTTAADIDAAQAKAATPAKEQRLDGGEQQDSLPNVQIRVRGTVQGVGFRPNVWRIANELKLNGSVCNDAAGVLIKLTDAAPDDVAGFILRLKTDVPPLAQVDAIDVIPAASAANAASAADNAADNDNTRTRADNTAGSSAGAGFRITQSVDGATATGVTPDAASCPACVEETLSPFERRYRYPFTNCTHCGPRFSIIERVPYDRAATSMKAFDLCPDCAREYNDPSDRRFHAQPVACYKCGPKAWLERLDGAAMSFEQHSMLDDVDAACSLLQKGEIVAIRGLGGFHLACDATNADAVARLRARKNRYAKPFALMARDLDIIKNYCHISAAEEALLHSPEAPIVLLQRLAAQLDDVTSDAAASEQTKPQSTAPNEPLAETPTETLAERYARLAATVEPLADNVAPGMATLGLMLPYMPLHHVMLRRMDRPIIMTSGNLSDEPQVTSNIAARERLKSIADFALFHDREIVNRIDDSVVRVMAGSARLLRRARGFAPAAIALPRGFERAPDLLAYGGEQKATFCLLKDGGAVLSQHQGDLEDAATYDDYCKNLELFTQLYDHTPQKLVADLHPDYLSTKLAQTQAETRDLPLAQVQHHHAHIASCMAENAVPLDANPVLGVVIDGTGYGEDGSIWGGEFLLADYRGFTRLGTFKPVPLLGGAQAIAEPWRNTYAHLMAEIGWPQLAMNFAELDLIKFLDDKPRATLDQMHAKKLNTPMASSCGRLFDAVAAAMGLARERAQYEGQGAMELEALVCEETLHNEYDELAYPFAIPNLPGSGLPYIEPIAMWNALLGDLHLKTPRGVMAARFHKGLAKIITEMVRRLLGSQERAGQEISTVVLSGGCFQNKILLEQVIERLTQTAPNLTILTQARVPANDGGLALGQAVIGAARHIYGLNGSGGA